MLACAFWSLNKPKLSRVAGKLYTLRKKGYNDNKKIIYLSWNLRKIMKKFKSEFSFPSYDIENDRIIFYLKVKPIFFNKKIILEKK